MFMREEEREKSVVDIHAIAMKCKDDNLKGKDSY